MKLQNLLVLLVFALAAQATEFHVATNGADANPGTKQSPFRTIQHAANLAQPGDVITVHAGIYRERINPPRGGASDTKRIVYQAAPGEKVVITGAEPACNWTRVTNDTWRVVIPNTFFGTFNPYRDVLHGDWCKNPGGYHTGAVYLNGDWLTETTNQSNILQAAGSNALWFASVDATNTTLWAQFPGVNPNAANVEFNVRQTVFTPAQTGINYLTVRGFELRAAAAPWAPPTAAQIGIISAYWCKGWIIENNRICYSPCCGVALGKYGDDWDNGEAIQDKPEWLKKEMKGGTGGYVATTERALTNGWNKATVGSHLVRNNEISHCEQTGIVGSLGCAFSTIADNEIHDIHVRDLYRGFEMAGIKFHGAIDVVIRHNHIYHCGDRAGIWLDWMGQGSQIIGNLMHDNTEDIFLEMQHGPLLVANNVLLSKRALDLDSEGMAFAQNLIIGEVHYRLGDDRITPFQPPHNTAIAGMYPSANGANGDHRFYNNLFAGNWDGSKLDKSVLPCFAAGNVFTKGTQTSKFDTESLVATNFDAGVKLEQKADGWYLTLRADKSWRKYVEAKLVTTDLLGKAKVSGCAYENPDGSALKIITDYFGNNRDRENPFPGPFEISSDGNQTFKVWFKSTTDATAFTGKWPAATPKDCPFNASGSLKGIEFTGRHAEYTHADTWYPSWAADGNLYSPWTDGNVNGLGSGSAKKNATTGSAKIVGDDPMNLQVVDEGIYISHASPYRGRYPCGSLVFDGVWYYGTYCLHPAGTVKHEGTNYNWPWLGPFVGFRYSTNFGKTWMQTPCTPDRPLFGESALQGEPVKIGSPHFVDFGKNLEHSPDGKAYLVAHGAHDGANRRFGYNSWITGDEIYLLRVTPDISNMNDASKYEFFAGHGFLGQPRWTHNLAEAKPIAAWRDNMGCVTMTYDAPLKKYLMCVTDGGNTTGYFNSYLLESDRITGPFKLAEYLHHFGEQAYFVNLPSKFISADGRTLWLCYAANFAPDWNGMKIQRNPPGSRYGMCLQEIKLTEK